MTQPSQARSQLNRVLNNKQKVKSMNLTSKSDAPITPNFPSSVSREIARDYVEK